MSAATVSLVFERMAPQRHGPNFSAALPQGAHAFVVPDAATGTSLLLCASGMLAPQKGRVHVGGVAPHKSPRLRASMPTLLPEEPPLPVETAPWGRFLRHRGSDPALREVLRRLLDLRSNVTKQSEVGPQDLLLIADLLDHPVSQLSAKDLRRVSLALALSLPTPTALLLFEPLLDLDAAEAAQVLDLLSQRAEAGVIVMFVVLQKRIAEHLAPNVLLLGRPPARGADAHYTVRTPVRELLARRLSAQGLRCQLDATVGDRLHIFCPNSEELLEKLTLVLAHTSDSSDEDASILSILEFYEGAGPSLDGGPRP